MFFKRILVHNKHLLRTDAPLLIVANHPNTFMDPMLIAHLLKQQVYFLANGGVFNSITKILFRQLNMVPIYRKADANANVGVNMREQNNKAFSSLDTVDQIRQSFLVLRTPIKESRIGTQIKGIVSEAKERPIYASWL